MKKNQRLDTAEQRGYQAYVMAEQAMRRYLRGEIGATAFTLEARFAAGLLEPLTT